MEEANISTLTGVQQKWIPTLMDDFEGFKISWEEETVGGAEKARELV